MNIKSILRGIRFLALLIGNMMMAGCSNSDKPAYLEPHLITTEATHITRTEATLNGSATIEEKLKCRNSCSDTALRRA